MIKRKYVIIALSLYIIVSLAFFANASLVGTFISKLAPASAAATGSGGGFTIPAKIIASTASGGSVASWISLAVPGTTAAKVATAVLSIGGALAADYLMVKGAAWFAANHITIDPITGDIEETTTTQIPDGNTKSDFADGAYHADQASATAACNANCVHAPPRYIYSPCGVAVYATYGAATCTGQLYPPGTAFAEKYYFPKAGVPTHDENNKTTLTPAQLENKLNSALASENADAKDVAKAALEVTAAAMDNPSHPVTNNKNVYNNIINNLTSNLTTNQLTNLEAAATPNVGDQVLPDDAETKAEKLTPAQIAAAVQAALSGQGLSAAQIAAAVTAVGGSLTPAQVQEAMTASLSAQGLSADEIKNAINSVLPALGAYTGEFSAAAWAKPVVGNFSNLFSTFLNNMKATPLFSLPGLLADSVPAGGSCEMSINLSERFGGSKSISICNWETGLSGMKAVLLCIASIFAVGIVTKGGNT